jgi:hypothetical protein
VSLHRPRSVLPWYSHVLYYGSLHALPGSQGLAPLAGSHGDSECGSGTVVTSELLPQIRSDNLGQSLHDAREAGLALTRFEHFRYNILGFKLKAWNLVKAA